MIISNIYKRAFNVLSKMPFKLWGLSLLSSLLTILVLVFGVLPIVIVPVIAVLSAGMAAVYLDGFNGKEVYSDQLFKGFKDFWRTAGGMCWKKLWIFIWFLVPIAGPFIAISKYYAYSFTPYILNEEKSVNATAALRKSMQDTNGYKLQMFCADLCCYGYTCIAFKDSVCRYIVCGYHSHSSACIYIVCTVVLRSCTRRFL